VGPGTRLRHTRRLARHTSTRTHTCGRAYARPARRTERARQRKELDLVLGERDILGTQLIRRNDELALLYEKVKIQQATLSRGQAQYKERCAGRWVGWWRAASGRGGGGGGRGGAAPLASARQGTAGCGGHQHTC
jgi:hypothetical protein